MIHVDALNKKVTQFEGYLDILTCHVVLLEKGEYMVKRWETLFSRMKIKERIFIDGN
jgi:hypothetical protein